MRRSSRSPGRPGCGCASACCAGPRSIGTRSRSASPARAASWSPCRSRRRSAKSSGRCAGIIPSYVFTYVPQRTRDGRMQGERHPLTHSGVKTTWRRLRKRAGVDGFRFHDFRHDFGTKLLRETGNLKLVQKALTTPTSRPRRATRTCSTTRWPRRWSASRSPGNKSRDQRPEGGLSY